MIGPPVKPPLGLMPHYLWIASRECDIQEAIDRYNQAGYAVPEIWITELKEIQLTRLITKDK